MQEFGRVERDGFDSAVVRERKIFLRYVEEVLGGVRQVFDDKESEVEVVTVDKEEE